MGGSTAVLALNVADVAATLSNTLKDFESVFPINAKVLVLDLLSASRSSFDRPVETVGVPVSAALYGC